MSCDDGVGTQHYAAADGIIVGVSRSGKTPTCLYLAMQYGVRAANYPLTEDDFEHQRLPDALNAHRARLMGLTIAPERLQQIRQERRPNSPYAALSQCQYEVRELQALLTREQIRNLDSTHMSIEEIAASIMHEMGLARRPAVVESEDRKAVPLEVFLDQAGDQEPRNYEEDVDADISPGEPPHAGVKQNHRQDGHGS